MPSRYRVKSCHRENKSQILGTARETRDDEDDGDEVDDNDARSSACSFMESNQVAVVAEIFEANLRSEFW